MPKTVLFVCTGNTCRSPMAEELLRQKTKSGGADLRIISAGTAASAGATAAAEAVQALQEEGMDLGGHQSRSVTGELLAAADLILTMTRNHKATLLQMDPGLRDKIFTLKEFVRYRDGDELARQVVELDREEGKRREKWESCWGAQEKRLWARREQLRRELGRVEEQLYRLQTEKEKELADVQNRRCELLQGRSQALDIADPLGGNQEVYRETREEIARELERLREIIMQTGEGTDHDSPGQ